MGKPYELKVELPDFLLNADNLHQALSDALRLEDGTYSFRDQYLLDSLLSKYPLKGLTAEEQHSNAIKKLYLSEERLRLINSRGFHPSYDAIIMTARRKILKVIGDTPSWKMFTKGRYSSGTSPTHKFGRSTPFDKYNRCGKRFSTVTPSAYSMFLAMIGQTPQWCAHTGKENIKVITYNVVSTVYKKPDCARTIGKEADGNMYLQLPVGSNFKASLKRVAGIDLTDQSYNQRLAREASIYAKYIAKGNLPEGTLMAHRNRSGRVQMHAGLATIDLADASNSLSWRLVFELLPPAWFELLDRLRSKTGLIDGHIHRWEMFSSMGNGFTFELESLIFWAIAASVADALNLSDTPLSVYGDDIIVDRRVARPLIAALAEFGFNTNLDKTFIEGPFYESCGKHYHYGIDVTPIYIRKPISSVYRYIWLLNRLRIWASDPKMMVCDPRLYSIWREIYKRLPWAVRGGACDVYADDSIYQWTSSGRPADRAVQLVKIKSLNGRAALLASWQGSGDEVSSFDQRDFREEKRDCGRSYITTSVPNRDELLNPELAYTTMGVFYPMNPQSNIFGLSRILITDAFKKVPGDPVVTTWYHLHYRTLFAFPQEIC